MLSTMLMELKTAQSLPRANEEEEVHSKAVTALEDRAISTIVNTPAQSLSELAAKLEALAYVVDQVIEVSEPVKRMIQSVGDDARRFSQ